jgi:hypothetical protein
MACPPFEIDRNRWWARRKCAFAHLQSKPPGGAANAPPGFFCEPVEFAGIKPE